MNPQANIQYPEFQGSQDDFWRDLDALGWSQRKLARKIGVTPATVTAWKAGGIPEYAKTVVAYALDAKATWERLDA